MTLGSPDPIPDTPDAQNRESVEENPFFGWGPNGSYLCSRGCCEALSTNNYYLVRGDSGEEEVVNLAAIYCVICGEERKDALTDPFTHGKCSCDR